MKIERLSGAEAEIMQVLWEKAYPMTAKEITQALADKHNWKTPTTHVLLIRLMSKGVLEADKSEKAHKYFPCVTEEEWILAESAQVSEKARKTIPAMVASLIESQQLSEKELDDISKLLEEKRRQLKRR